jgi:serine/threonine-protein kinase
MPETAPSPASADRNLLFGVLALQADLIDNDRFVEACTLWASYKQTPLADLLVGRGWLTPEERGHVEFLLSRKLQKHRGDARASLAEVTTDEARRSLAGLDDTDVRRSLAGLATPPAGPVLAGTTAYVPESRGRFALSRLHATGGIGRVWLAHDDALGRDIALKELRPERAGQPAVTARFLQEARITGQLEHPGVVPIYEVGRRPDDQQPFYTMRFVRGRTLAEAAAAYHTRRARGEAGPLELRALLGAFVGVCNAVAYAHSRGVLHRDLKPQNVVLGDFGEVIVLDWGLARLLGQPDGEAEEALLPIVAAGAAEATVQGQVLGTPAYMAPEQAEGRLDQLGPSTDVYGLGAILYEVLCGRPPFAGSETTAVLRRVIHEPPPRPRELAAGTPRALEAVCLKALAKEPAQRYVSARALAAEVEHWLAGEPVAAYREPWPARLARWGRRHRPLVAAALALLLTGVAALVAGIVVVNGERQRTEQARQRTRAALDEMSSQVIEDWLSRKGPLESAQRTFLEKALSYYEEFAKESGQTEEVRKGVADAYRRVGNIRYRLGQHAEAEAAYRRALELHAGLAGDFPTAPPYRQELAQTHLKLGNMLMQTGRPREAEATYREAQAVQRSLAADFPDVPQYRHELAITHNNLGNLWQEVGRSKEAEAAYREAQAVQKSLAADFPAVPQYRRELAITHNNLGTLLARTGRPQEAEAAHREALAIRKALAAEYPAVPRYRQELASTHTNLGGLLYNVGRLKEAEAAIREALALYKALAADFPGVPQYRYELAGTLTNLGNLLKDTGRAKEAETATRNALDHFKALAADFPGVPQYRYELAGTHNNLGGLLQNTGRPQEAEAAYTDALDLLKALAADFPAVPDYQAELANTLEGLAELARRRKDHPAARRLLEEARPHTQAALEANPRHPFYRVVFCEIRKDLAVTLLELGEHAGAAVAAADLARVAHEPAADAFKAAGLLSRCVPLAERDSKLPEGQRKELAQSYADQALAALRQAVAKGYKDADHLKKDPDLDPLRGRDDFLKLLAELEAAARPKERASP